MENFRYILEPYQGKKTRYDCPACGGRGTFARYIDIYTNEYIHNSVGRCNREEKCGYHYSPKQFFGENSIQVSPLPEIRRTMEKINVSYIDPKIFQNSLKSYHKNKLIIYLKRWFSPETVEELITKYKIGSSNHWEGATVFWQIDISGRIRTGKIMLYDEITGKRVKEPSNCISWAHSALKLPDFGLNQCLFGEHLLKDTEQTAMVVESEKTAIIASAYFPQFVWLATGGLSNINYDKFKILGDRRIILFPDAGCAEKWRNKVIDYKGLNITVFRDFDNEASGTDLADLLIEAEKNKRINRPNIDFWESEDIRLKTPNAFQYRN